MRFDTDRAFASVASFSELIKEGQPLGRVETAWREAGWDVTRLDRPSRVHLRRLSKIVQAGLVVICVLFGRFTSGWLCFASLFAAGFGLLGMAMNAGFHFTKSGRIHVLSTSPVQTDRPRMIVLTTLSPPSARLSSQRRWLFAGFAGVAGLLSATVGRDWPYIIQLVCATWFVQSLVFLVVDFLPNENTSDNASGLAFIDELARTWPKLARSRVDVQFMVIDAPEGTTVDLVDAVDASTLIVDIIDPGLACPFQLAGDDVGLDLADSAANDLWIPKIKSLIPPKMPGEYGGFVRLEGDISSGEYEPAALGRAGQLVLELALRWGKRLKA